MKRRDGNQIAFHFVITCMDKSFRRNELYNVTNRLQIRSATPIYTENLSVKEAAAVAFIFLVN